MLEALNKLPFQRVLRFLITGGLAAAVEYGAFVLLRIVSLPVIWANTLSFLCGLVVSFTLNKHWVFAAKGNTKKQFVMYFVLAAVNLLLSDALIYVLTAKLDLRPLIAKLCVMLLIATWNYVFFSRLVFKDRHLDV